MPNANTYIGTGTDYPTDAKFVSPDVMMAAASYVEREWGGYSYRLACIAASPMGGAVFQGRASDGSTFAFQLDRDGNVIPMDAPMADAIRRDVAPKMHRAFGIAAPAPIVEGIEASETPAGYTSDRCDWCGQDLDAGPSSLYHDCPSTGKRHPIMGDSAV